MSGNNGQPLPANIRTRLESAFGQDLSEVRIHTNSPRATSMGAKAYAIGNDIHFAPGQYQPSSANGKELIAHEAAHVVQQKVQGFKPNRQGRDLAERAVKAMMKKVTGRI
jgi:hypothetical protein